MALTQLGKPVAANMSETTTARVRIGPNRPRTLSCRDFRPEIVKVSPPGVAEKAEASLKPKTERRHHAWVRLKVSWQDIEKQAENEVRAGFVEAVPSAIEGFLAEHRTSWFGPQVRAWILPQADWRGSYEVLEWACPKEE